MKHLLFLLTLLIALPVGAREAGERVRVACVGNSVTYGYLLKNRERDAYPSQLQAMLGKDYDVRNFGHSGATLLRHGHRPYMALPEFRAAVDFKPELVVIHLGLNDTDPRNWPNYSAEFIPDYRALIDSFRVANPAARIWICLMTPIFPSHGRFDSGTREWHGIIQARIAQIARTAGVGLIDLYTPLHNYPNLFPDALHPDPEGAKILARTVYQSLTGDHGGLALSPLYTDHMVMQRDQAFALEGTANAGERVEARFLGKKLRTEANADGQWRIALPAQPAGGPYTLQVSTKARSLQVNDIYFGEVWVCSGQSNMEFRLRQCATAKEDMAAAAANERIHLYNMLPIATTYAVQWDSLRIDSIDRLLYLQPGTWQKASAEAAGSFSAIGYHFARVLADSLGCHVGVICNAVGGSGTESWIDRTALEEHFPAMLRGWKQSDYIQPWVRERAAQNISLSKNPLSRHPYEPGYLFAAGILPLQHYPVKGVCWYQGESNAHNTEHHERLFRLLVDSWRGYWGKPNLPFHYIQLSSIAPRASWPSFRNSQRLLAADTRSEKSIPEAWMTVSSDLGDSLDVHPTHKREIGERLAASALARTYGRAVTPSGPAYRGFTCEGKQLRLRFDYADGLHAAQGALIGFEVAGDDGLFHPATAHIEGKDVVVKSPAVKQPTAVRYGYTPFTHANLVNAAGYPCSTFIDEK